MLQESYFTLPIVATLAVLDTVVPAPVVSSPLPTLDENLEPVSQDPLEPPVVQQEEQQQPHIAPNNENLRRSQELEDQLYQMIMRFMKPKNFIWKMIPLHMNKP